MTPVPRDLGGILLMGQPMRPNQRSSVLTFVWCATLLMGLAFLSRESSVQAQSNSTSAAAGGQRPEQGGVLDPVNTKTDLYPAEADARKDIDKALQQATTEKKKVILVFGANWCYDCHALDRALHEGPAGKIVQENFLVVHVDIGEGDKNLDLAKKYKIPLEKGVPAVAILDHDAHLLYSSGSGEFEAARRMMKKDLVAFLQRWIQTSP